MDQKQMSEIESYLSGLSSEVDILKEQKINLTKKIMVMDNSKTNDKKE